MSVMPNITIYGDVKPSEINKGLISERLGMPNVRNRKAIAASKRELAGGLIEYEGPGKEI